MSELLFLAGPSAYRRIKQEGLSPADISAVFGASGAAKWLAIHGLDKAIFQHWLTDLEQPVHLFGTSIGAWKLAAAATNNPGEAMDQLAQAYIEQTYGPKSTRHDVARQCTRILEAFLPQHRRQEILANPSLRFHCGTVRSKGLLSLDLSPTLMLAMAKAAVKNIGGRQALHNVMDRVIFHDPRSRCPLDVQDGYHTRQVPLGMENLSQALTASGSIPYVLPGVRNIKSAPRGTYRDGGVLDYHPIPGNFWRQDDSKIILYPHFYSHLVPGWFDKFFKSRKATPKQLDNVLLVSPSPAFVNRMPERRIPDRKDFDRFQGDDTTRMRNWNKVIQNGHQLGDAFLEACNSGRIKTMVRPIR
ncbi:hypothetical protein ACWJJH_09530 [Endozoicomonadaceae bacterium StTr2]